MSLHIKSKCFYGANGELHGAVAALNTVGTIKVFNSQKCVGVRKGQRALDISDLRERILRTFFLNADYSSEIQTTVFLMTFLIFTEWYFKCPLNYFLRLLRST